MTRFANFKPILNIPEEAYGMLLWMVNQPHDSPFLKWQDFKATKRIIVDREHGLDPFSAFYADVHLNDRCSTRVPSVLQKLYDCYRGIDEITDAWALDIVYGSETYARLRETMEKENWHPQLYDEVLLKINTYYREV